MSGTHPTTVHAPARTPEPTAWSPGSWRARPAAQQPDWPDPEQLARVENTLALQPPLVLPAEIMELRGALGDVARGRGFLLQAGDCAERFSSCTEDGVRSKLRVILQVAILLTYGAGLPVVKVGRIGGQFGKPRSKPTETVDGVELPAFRGDIVNAPEFTAEARRPDADRLLRAYHHSSAAVNVLRALTHGGFADLDQAHAWNQEFVRRSAAGRRYEKTADEITWALKFMAACGVDVRSQTELHQIQLYTSHEALLPHYEQALTRFDEQRRAWFDTSAHMVWIGDRTRQAPTSSCCRVSATRWGSRSAPAPPRRTCASCASASTRSAHRAVWCSSPGSARARRPNCCRRCCVPCGTRGTSRCGPATRCTATPSSRRAATRRGG